MANATVSRLGQANGAGDAQALFLKVFAGEVLTSFEKKNVTMGRHMVRTISNGKSASFPVMGRATASYHTPGNQILGGTLKHNEKIISINDLLIAPQFIANIDEAMNHYDVRSTYSKEMGNVLANQMDKHVLQTAVLAARATKTIDDTDQFGGTRILNVDGANGDALADAMFEAARVLDEKDVPDEDRVLFVRPAQFYALAKSTKVINRDWGGEGSYAGGNVIRVANITIVKTNNLPSTNVTTGTVAAGTGDRHLGDFSATLGVIFHPSAIGTVKLLDLSMESEYQVSRQGTLLVAKYAVGHGVLRPEASVELSSAAA